MFHKKTIHKITVIAALLAIFLVSCGVIPPISGQSTTEPEPTADKPQGPPVVSATAVIVPERDSTLSMTTPGLVSEVLIEKGDLVEAGQTLVRLEGREEMQAAITGAEYEVRAAEKAIDDLYEVAEDASTLALNSVPTAARRVRDAQYQLDNYTIPSSMEDMEAMEALDWAKERLDEAREAYEPYRNKSNSDTRREELKEDLDNAQSDYNSAVRRVEYETALDVAQSDLDKAREDYATYSQGPAPKDIELAQARLRNAEASLAAAESALNDLELLAPFSGTIGDVYTSVGEWVNPGMPIVLLADLEHLQVETTDLNEIDAAQVSVGDSVTITFDALDDVLTGTVISIAPKASEGTGVNYTVVVALDEWPGSLRWGMTAYVDIEIQ